MNILSIITSTVCVLGTVFALIIIPFLAISMFGESKTAGVTMWLLYIGLVCAVLEFLIVLYF